MKIAVPNRAILVLMSIGLIDLFATAILHAQGRIVELNPLMRVFIERSELLFALVKGATLVLAWVVLARYSKTNPAFVRNACIAGSIAYMTIWLTAFFGAR